MKAKNKKWLLGSLATIGVVAPVTTLVACGSSTTIPTISDKGTVAWTGGPTIGGLEDKARETEDSAASSNFLSQIKYEVAEKMYEKEQAASFDYQEAFLKWNIFTVKKEQLNKAKEILALKKTVEGTVITSSQIKFEDADKADANYIGKLLGKSDADATAWVYSSDEIANFIKSQNDKTVPANTDPNYANITSYNAKIKEFKATEENLVKTIEKSTKVSQANRASFDWNATGIASDFPKLLKPISKIRELQTKSYNEAKDAFIENYRTKGDGTVEWSKERPSKYDGATTDEEAIKSLVNKAVQTAAFNQYQYALNESFTMEQFLAVDENGKKIFSWFENQILGDKDSDTAAIDTSLATTPDKNVKVFTNSAKEFLKTGTTAIPAGYAQADLISINTKAVKPASDKTQPLLNNKVYFLGRSSMQSSEIIADLTSAEEKANFNGNPILMTHGLIAAKQPTDPSLPWEFKKADLIDLMTFYGNDKALANTQGLKIIKDAASGSTTAADSYKRFTDYISNDKESRKISGEMGVKSLMDYMAPKGFVDGWVLGTMAAYTDMHRAEVTTQAGTEAAGYLAAVDSIIGDVSNPSTTHPGVSLIDGIMTKLWAAIPATVTSTITATTDTTVANQAITAYINSLTDDEVKNKFGYIMTEALRDREAAYQIRDGVYAVPSEYGLHIVQITSENKEWNKKLMDDLKAVAVDKSTTKAKVKWSEIYKTIFTTERIVETLIAKPEIETAIREIPKNDAKLFDEWVKNKFFDIATGADDAAKGDAILAAAHKTIDALKLENNSKKARAALQPRINEYLQGQMDKKFMETTTDLDTLYNAFMFVLEGMK